MQCTCNPATVRPTGHPSRPDTYRVVRDDFSDDGAWIDRHCGYCGLYVSTQYARTGVTCYFTTRPGFA